MMSAHFCIFEASPCASPMHLAYLSTVSADAPGTAPPDVDWPKIEKPFAAFSSSLNGFAFLGAEKS